MCCQCPNASTHAAQVKQHASQKVQIKRNWKPADGVSPLITNRRKNDSMYCGDVPLQQRIGAFSYIVNSLDRIELIKSSIFV